MISYFKFELLILGEGDVAVGRHAVLTLDEVGHR